MLYQITGALLLPILGVDLLLVVALYFLPRIKEQSTRILCYSIVILFALATSFFKLLRISPSIIPSSPVHVTVRSEHRDLFRSFYYITQHHGRTFATWKSYMPSTSIDATLEAEDVKLFLAMQRDNQWLFTPIHAIPRTGEAIIDLDTAHFLPDQTGASEEAIVTRYKWEAGNYLSSFLTLVLVVLLVQRLWYLGSGITKTSLHAPVHPSLS
jgi:hypothetical protein